jgi:anaerobic ribonucleoside-triphosphate reductase activating protein
VDGGTRVAVAALFRRIVAAGNAEGAVGTDSADLIKGVTVSGGEPLQQMGAVAALLGRVRRETALSVVLFTGYAWEEVGRMPAAAALLKCVDVLVAGRYDATQRLDESRDLRSSANQTVHLLTGRYTPADLAAVPPAEAVVAPDGSVVLSGLGGVRWE